MTDSATLPFVTSDLGSTGGVMRTSPQDFRVEEIPAYTASGEGEHLFVTFEKTGVATTDAVEAIARALGAPMRECGWAGLKDKHAVTVQTASFPRVSAEWAMALALPNITVLAAARHRNKLKPGHLHGNRFTITLRQCEPGAREIADAVAARLKRDGMANYYGAQRFGKGGDNATRARSWLLGEWDGPRDGFKRKMLASALQSELFNAYVAERVTDGLLSVYVPGDLAVRHPLDKVFAIEPDEARETYADGRCSATGPMFGPEMRWPDGEARVREEKTLAESGLTLEHFGRARGLAEGTRRAVRVPLSDLTVSGGDAPETLVLAFTLPAGGYATTVLREFRKHDGDGLHNDASSGIEPAAAEPA